MNPLLLSSSLAAVALVLSVVLLMKSLTGGGLPGCGAGSGCDEVTRGRWARIGSMPVAFLGVLAYLTLATSALAANFRPTEQARAILLTAAAAAIGAAAWFILLQAIAIRRFCRWCTYTHTLAAAAGTIALYNAWKASTLPSLPLIIGAGLVALLVLAQLLVPARTYQLDTTPAKPIDAIEDAEPPPSPPPEPETTLPPSPGTPGEGRGEGRAKHAETVAAPTPEPEAPIEQSPAPTVTPPPPRRLTAVRGAISLSPHLWPVLGNRDATHILIDQFDYTCHLCRDLHNMMLKAIERYPADIAVLMMPVPLDRNCNPTLQYQNPEHVNACEYARHALAVFRAAPEKFPEYDHWLFETPRPRPLVEMKQRAAALATPEKLAAALADPWLGKRINEAIAIYDAIGRGSIPKLLLPESVLMGQLPTLDRMLTVLQKQLKLPV